MNRWNTCYVCGGYSRGKRHRACTPSYKRRRFVACAGCGQPSRGDMHRRCRFPDARKCDYCKEPVTHVKGGTGPTTGFHHKCRPSRPPLAIFADMPEIIQRRCTACGEWYPFAAIGPSVDDVADEYWKVGRDRRGRDRENICRSCSTQRRAEWKQRAAA